MRSSMRALFAAAMIVGALGACAKDVVDIDRTQPNRVSKELFQGEWYFRPTVMDVQYNQGMIFEGYEGEMDRIRWDIREDQIVAYRSYELLEGAENGNGSPAFHGSPVAAFRILSHFDVKRDYNPATGEQSNVILENITDRPWYERSYMRIDWSKNMIDNPMSIEGMLSAVSGAPYYVQEHEIDNPDRAEVTANNINIVNNYLLTPDINTCYYALLDYAFCGTSQAKMKLSFRKVTPSDYEPQYYPDALLVRDSDNKIVYDSNNQPITLPMFERFGFFRTQRLAYDNEYQWTRNGRIYLANRWNIWRKNHRQNGELIPAAERQPGSFKYYTNADFPTDADIWNASQQLVQDWDNAFLDTAREVKRQGDPLYELPPGTRIFTLEKNACNLDNVRSWAKKKNYSEKLAEYGIASVERGNLKNACSVLEFVSNGDFTWQKAGDLRYSYLHWVDTTQQAGPLGYGPSAPDPITGEIISANANMYGASIDTYSAFAADVVQLMNGKLSTSDLQLGVNIREQVQRRFEDHYGSHNAAKMAQLRERFERTERPIASKPMSVHEASSSAKALGTLSVAKRTAMDEQLKQYTRVAARGKLDRIKGSSLERELLASDEIKRAALGPDKYQPSKGVTANNFSPLGWMLDDQDLYHKHREARRTLMAHSITMADEWSDEGMTELATQLKDMDWQQVYNFMRREMFRSVAAHEVGHTLGLRHNFEASMDALNYAPEFWDHYNPTTGKVERFTNGQPTRAQRVMYSSIMDYDARFYADSLEGIGAYDKAAIHFGYGNLVQVFEEGVPNIWYTDLMSFYDYSDIPKILSGEKLCTSEQNCPDSLLSLFAQGGSWDQYQQALTTEDPVDDKATYEHVSREQLTYLKNALDGNTPHVENIWKRKYIPFESIKDSYAANGFSNAPEVPYKFCPDEWSWESNITCQPYDKGANFREITQDRMSRYDQYYFFSNFKRDRLAFNDSNYINTYLTKVISRFFSPMSSVYRYYLFGFQSLGRDSLGRDLNLNDWPLGQDWQAAAMDGLNYLGSVLMQPEPGKYCLNASSNTYSPWTGSDADYRNQCSTRLEVPVGIGKYYNTNWTDEYNYKATRIGLFWDKYAALWAMTDNEGSFYQNFNDMLDQGAFALSYWRGMKSEMLDLFGSTFTGNTSKFVWRFNPGGQNGDFSPMPVVDQYNTGVDIAGLPKIESSSSWTLRYYGIVLSMARFNSMYDYTEDFSNYARVCIEGYMDCQAISQVRGSGSNERVVPGVDGIDFTSFTDPLTGYRYIAAKTPTVDGALGAQLLSEAKTFVDEVYTPAHDDWSDAKDAYDDAVEDGLSGSVLESLYQNMLNKEADLSQAERGMNERSSYLDIIRDISYQMEYGG